MKDTRTYADRADYLKIAVAKRRRVLKQKAIIKGSKCNFCGYNRCLDALEFHHLDEKTKKFALSARGLTRSWLKVQDELNKCILVCANCHREIHAGITAASDCKVRVITR